MEHDAIIIGATAEGLAAALTGASIGMDVAIVDPEGFLASRATPPGPFMLSLLHDTLTEIRAAHRVLGWESTPRDLRDLFGRILAARHRGVVRSYHAEMRRELTACGVQVLRGRPRLRSANAVEISRECIHSAQVVIVATGSRPRKPVRFPFDGRTLCDCDSVLAQADVPRNMMVVGADLLGCEFSCMFAALGTDVTLVDRRSRLLRFVDSDLREVLHGWMQSSGVTVVLGESVEGVEIRGSNVGPYASVALGSGRLEVIERVLIAAGAAPNSAELGLERLGVATNASGFIPTDDRFQTCVRGIYAVGGVVDGNASTTQRIHQGRVAMLCAAGVDGGGENPTPMVIYTIPEIATVGLSEEACALLDVPHVLGRSGLGRPLRSKMRGEHEGLLKLVISSETHRLLGVHVIGPSAAEVVGLGAALMRRDGTLEEIASIGLSPQSLSEAYHRAAFDALTKLGRPAPAPNDEPIAPSRAF